VSIESALYSVVSTNAGVQALIGSGSPVIVRFYPAGRINQDDVLPGATYQTIAGSPANVFERAPADNKRIQIDCWSLDFDNAQAIEEAIRAALEDSTVPTTYGLGAQCIGFNGNDFDPDTRRYRSSSDWSLWQSR
jgi:hypothetical protein